MSTRLQARARARQRVEFGATVEVARGRRRKTLNAISARTPSRPRLPTNSLGRSKPAAFLTTLPPRATSSPCRRRSARRGGNRARRRSGSAPGRSAGGDGAAQRRARTRRAAGRTADTARARQRRLHDVGTGVPASAVKVNSSGSYSTTPRSPDTSSGATPSARRRQRRLGAAAARRARRGCSRTARSAAPRHAIASDPARAGAAGAVAGAPPGEHLAGIGELERIDGARAGGACIDFVGGEHARQEVALLHADAVLAGDRAAHLDAHLEDLAGERLGALVRRRARGRRTGSADEGCRRRRGRRSPRACRARAPSARSRASASPSRVRGTTPSCTMKSGASRPTALNALLRPFQIGARSSASSVARTSVAPEARDHARQPARRRAATTSRAPSSSTMSTAAPGGYPAAPRPPRPRGPARP